MGQKGWWVSVMAGLDEGKIIGILQGGIAARGLAHEDVQVFGRGPRGVAVAVDTLVESTDVPPGMKMPEISRKAVAACVSDFAAKGIRPEFGVISVTVPRRLSRRQAAGLAEGFQRASREFGVKILGGDTSGGAELSISVTLCGAAGRIVPRGGAKAGDRIFATGSFGDAAAGLRLLLNGRRSGRAGPDAGYRSAFCSPKPKLEFGVRAGRHVSSAMDSSDGLAKTLNEMARQSGKRFVLTRLPYEKPLEAFAGRSGMRVEDLVLYGGEEYETVFTAQEKNIPRIESIARGSGCRITEIGSVEGGRGVRLQAGGRDKKIPDRGWNHRGRVTL